MLPFLFALISVAEPIEMAITVDDLPKHAMDSPFETRLQIAQKFLEVFKKHNLTGVYGFVNADKLSDGPEMKAVLAEWVMAGHFLGNHTWSHINLTKNSAEDFFKDVDLNEPILRQLMGDKDWHYFRYPFLREGNEMPKRNAVRDYLQKKNYKIAQVTLDWEDYAWNNPYTRCRMQKDQKAIEWLRQSHREGEDGALVKARMLSKQIFGRQIKHILLLHIGGFESQVLDELLTSYKKQNVKFISLAEAVADPLYQQDPKVVYERGDTFLDQWMVSKNLSYPKGKWKSPPLEELDKICR